MLGYIVSVYFGLSSHTNNFVWWQRQGLENIEKACYVARSELNRSASGIDVCVRLREFTPLLQELYV
ncbi:hypothetical protein ELI24_35120 [Rhizobium ruizarguesonis]|nr:hypothetical protein ELI24_35120 [Rhizobium ruizarguesonis]